MKNTCSIILFFLLSIVNAQEYKLNRVTEEELKQKRHPSDTTASAAVLFEIGTTNFEYNNGTGFDYITRVITKIKIYKKDGFEFANQSHPYFSGNGTSQRVIYSGACTYNLVNGKIVKSRIKSEGEFDEKINANVSVKKITFPDVKEGSIIEFEMIFKSPYINKLLDWNFQHEIPVDYSEYTTIIPEYYSYNVYQKGFFNPATTKSTKNGQASYSYNISGNSTEIDRKTVTLEYTENITNYVLKNIPALKDEPFVNNLNNYRSTLIHEISGIRMPKADFKDYSIDWESTVKTIYNEESFGNELKKTNYFEDDLKPLLKESLTRDEKIQIIFDFVKNRMSWNEDFSIYCDQGVKAAYKNKVGNSAEINLMLVSMLRFAAIEANPIVLSTRHHGIALYPSRSAFNNVIAAVEILDNVILLDATSKNATLNTISLESLNWSGRIIRKEGTSAQVNLIPQEPSLEYTKMTANLQADGNISGSISNQYSKYSAFTFRETVGKLSKELYLEKAEKEYPGLEIKELELQNKADVNESINETYNFEHSNSTDVIGNKLYCNALLFLSELKNPFTQEKRAYPVDFVFPIQKKYLISLNIPEGFKIESLPTPANIVLGDNLATFSYNISSTGNQIQILSKMSFNQALISSENYTFLKQFYSQLVAKNAEKIILTKS